MSLSAGLPGFKTTDGGLKYSGFQGPVLAGKIADGVGASLPAAGGLMCVQSTASITNQIVSTGDTVVGSRASFLYVPVTTGTLTGAAAPPYVGVGAAICWDDANKTLNIWSSGSGAWLHANASSSTLLTGTAFTSS